MKHLMLVEEIPSKGDLIAMEKPYVLLEKDTNKLQYTYIEPKSTRWWNGDILIKELDVIGELTFAYKEESTTRCEIGTNVTSIGMGAFSSFHNLTSVEIPNSVTNIDMHAFTGCNSLTSVVIPNSVTSIGIGAFGGCTSLTSVTYNGVTYTSRSALETALTNKGITIGDWAFENTALTD